MGESQNQSRTKDPILETFLLYMSGFVCQSYVLSVIVEAIQRCLRKWVKSGVCWCYNRAIEEWIWEIWKLRDRLGVGFLGSFGDGG